MAVGCYQAPRSKYVVPATFGILKDCEDMYETSLPAVPA
jgi:hypothetical protein